jgi:small subunit ribosomal protein S4
MHGQNAKRRKKSEYGLQLREKQKAKYTYGVLERQFSNLFKKAASSTGKTGDVLLQLLESRLDNVIYRLGLSNTRAGARQLVSHRHVIVNGNVVNIPSYLLKPGDMVGVREKSKSMEIINNSLHSHRHNRYAWLEWEDSQMVGKFINRPERDDIPENIKEQLIVELYSK